MADDSIEELRQVAQSGDSLALTRLAERLLQGRAPAEHGEAAQALDRATRGGGVEAPAMLATLFAMGVAFPQNIRTALELLQIGAERGSSAARGQLAILADGDAEAGAEDEPDHWRRLREAIDRAAWAAPVPQEVVSRSPRIFICKPFISPATCAWIISRAEGRTTRAKVFDPEARGLRIEEARNNSTMEFKLGDMDVVMALLRAKIGAAVGVSPTAMEPPQVLHYRPGQRFEPHYDFLDPEMPGHVAEVAEHGQRIATCLVYLNDGFEGGETDFPILGVRSRPPAGGALCFLNVQPSGQPDRRTLHAGLSPTSGEKWIISQWIRDRGAKDGGPAPHP
jgi:hypothetical protein